MWFRNALLLPCLLSVLNCSLRSETVSTLLGRGFTVMPEPQLVKLTSNDFPFTAGWRLEVGQGIPAQSSAVESLTQELEDRYHLHLKTNSNANEALLLEIIPGSIVPGPSQDADREAIAAQAYKIELAPSGVRITANAESGLFYGVQTFIQLLKPKGDGLWLPQGDIADWPDLQLRHIYWDDAHHLEYLPELKRAVRQASFFKINGFVIKLEGHFQYQSANAVVEPNALSPAELQELTDYGLRYHVQVIPYLDAPAHIAFILKHPEYAPLREFADSNYELCVSNPDAIKLITGMFNDLLAANKGVKYFYLSTDEAYYVGLSNKNGCSEAQRAKELGSVGKVLSEFVTQTAGYLHHQGREVIFWGEYPLKPADIETLPPYLINGETYGEQFDSLFKSHGIRQMLYNSTEGEERLFPQYFLRPPDQRLQPLHEDDERIKSTLSQISSDTARKNSDLTGMVIAGWGDMGLHPETFWLGYASITSSAWKIWTAGAREAMSTFYPLFYGHSIIDMNRIYQLMSTQAQIWSDTWDSVDSKLRKPIWGDSSQIFHTPHPAHDETLPLPLAPSPDLRYNGNWARDHEGILRAAGEGIPSNDELQGLLRENLQLASSNRYNLEVFLSIAGLCRENMEMILGLKQLEDALRQADAMARAGKASLALAAVDGALLEVQTMRNARNSSLADATTIWYKAWLPRVEEANGRRFLHQVDDVKDHLPDRTVDMSYLVYRELHLPLQDWYQRTQTARNKFAAAHHLPERKVTLDWSFIK